MTVNKRIRDTPVIVVPEGYEPWEVVETDDEGYDFRAPIEEEEVGIIYEYLLFLGFAAINYNFRQLSVDRGLLL